MAVFKILTGSFNKYPHKKNCDYKVFISSNNRQHCFMTSQKCTYYKIIINRKQKDFGFVRLKNSIRFDYYTVQI